MNKHKKKLLKKAGFVLWKKEPWKPEGHVVDWSSNYDQEVSDLIDLVVDKCLNEIMNTYNSQVESMQLLDARKRIMKKFYGE